MKLLWGLLLCVAVVQGEGVTELADKPRDPSVLRIVSTLITPYLELRPEEPEPEVVPETNAASTEAMVTDVLRRLRREAESVSPAAAAGAGATEGPVEVVSEPEATGEPEATAGPELAAGAGGASTPTSGSESVSKSAAGSTQATHEAGATQETEVESKAATHTPAATSPAVTDAQAAASQTSSVVSQSDDDGAANVTSSSEISTAAADVATTEAILKSAATTAESVTTESPKPMTPYMGFIPDLMDLMLPHIPNITAYEIYTVDADDENSAYTNMLNEVISGRADVAAGPMTVTLNKEKLVDFTYPFQRVEATIVMLKFLENRIQSLEDLVNQDPNDEEKPVNYGVRIDGAIHQVLKASDDPLHKKMLKHLNTNEVALKPTNAQGINRARLGGYAFILEGSIADWVVGQPPCTLMGIKAGFFKRQYAFAVRQMSEWRDKLNMALVEVDDELQDLHDKWLTPGECSGAPTRMSPILQSSLLISLLTILAARFM